MTLTEGEVRDIVLESQTWVESRLRVILDQESGPQSLPYKEGLTEIFAEVLLAIGREDLAAAGAGLDKFRVYVDVALNALATFSACLLQSAFLVGKDRLPGGMTPGGLLAFYHDVALKSGLGTVESLQ